MTLPKSHPALVIDGVPNNMTHLDAFAVAVTGKGCDPGSDLHVLVTFSSHVFTERALHGEAHHTEDHHGTKRAFDPARYAMSRRLPQVIRDAFFKGALCFVSRDFGGYENLMMIEVDNAETWSIVFCFEPLRNGVVMEVLSIHPKSVDDKGSSRKPLVFYARTCMFEQHRVPKN